jgi:predicted ribosomally synthesized peptide with SipW-like signal peptide
MTAAACLGLLYTASAYFDDTEASTENTFTAGTWAVEGGGNHTVHDLSVGDSGTETWPVKNTGTMDVNVDMDVSVTGSGIGEPEDFMTAHLYASDGADIYGPDAISGMSGSYSLDLLLGPGESWDIILEWTVSEGYEPGENDEVRVIVSFDIQPAP